MPNALAYLALLLWPLVVMIMFRRLPPDRAVIWSLLGGYLLLPPASHAFIDLPAIPPLDKMSIPALSTYFGAVFVANRPVPLLPSNPVARILLICFVLTPFGTVLTNPEPIFIIEGRVLPGLTLYEAISNIANQAFVILTFALARSLLASASALREILIALMVAGLAYSLPMLVEVRLSPQLNTWIYGFFQHSFEQMMRQGGYRPIVFLAHGLWVAFFAMTAVLATLGLARTEEGAKRKKLLLAAAYMMAVLVLCKSIGSLAFAVVGAPIVYLLGQKWQLHFALAMGLLALCYPVLRANGYIPADELVAMIMPYSEDRALSLDYRFRNEAMLVQHAFEKAWFGWGGFERNLIHDRMTGEVVTISDGWWVIVLGMAGWSGYIAEFGLLTLPLVLLWLRDRQGDQAVVPAAATLAVIHGINMVDLLPNATLTPLTWLIAGALLGYAETAPRPTRAEKKKRQLQPIL